MSEPQLAKVIPLGKRKKKSKPLSEGVVMVLIVTALGLALSILVIWNLSTPRSVIF